MQESLKESNLEEINKDNLMQGRDNEGNNMPSYLDSNYSNFKTTINPRNRGFWDLRITGRFQSGIFALVKKKEVDFKQKFDNKKTRYIFGRKSKTLVLGMQIKQFEQVQIDNKPKLFKQLDEIISQGK